MKPAAFFDRDGVLNVDHGYVHRIEDWAWVAGAPEALRRAALAGFTVIVVTNQSGIGRGFYDAGEVDDLHKWVEQQVPEITRIYYCPHGPDDGCPCRKPAPGMLLRAAAEHDLDLSRSFLVGDKPSDLEAARAAGVRGHHFFGEDLDAFVAAILAEVS